MKQPQPARVTDWANEPLILSTERVSEIFGVTPKVIRLRVKDNRFPQPFLTHPMRWYRSDFERAASGTTKKFARPA